MSTSQLHTHSAIAVSEDELSPPLGRRPAVRRGRLVSALRLITCGILGVFMAATLSLLMVIAVPLMIWPPLFRFFGRQAKIALTSFAAILSYMFLGHIEFVITGDPSLAKRQIIFSNHQTLLDWWFLGLLTWHEGTIDGLIIILMNYLKYIPFFGWLAYFVGFIFLKQEWAKDEKYLKTRLTALANRPNDSLVLLIFPEGLLVHARNLKRAREFIEKQKADAPPGTYIPRPPVNVILPRSKGLRSCLQKLNSPGVKAPVDKLVSVTMGYWPSSKGFETGIYPNDVLTPLAFFGKGTNDVISRVCIDFREMKGPENGVEHLVSLTDTEFDSWLKKKFEFKDDMLTYFHQRAGFEGFIGLDGDDSISVDADTTRVFKIKPKFLDYVRVLGAFVALWGIVAGCVLLGLFLR